MEVHGTCKAINQLLLANEMGYPDFVSFCVGALPSTNGTVVGCYNVRICKVFPSYCCHSFHIILLTLPKKEQTTEMEALRAFYVRRRYLRNQAANAGIEAEGKGSMGTLRVWLRECIILYLNCKGSLLEMVKLAKSVLYSI